MIMGFFASTPGCSASTPIMIMGCFASTPVQVAVSERSAAASYIPPGSWYETLWGGGPANCRSHTRGVLRPLHPRKTVSCVRSHPYSEVSCVRSHPHRLVSRPIAPNHIHRYIRCSFRSTRNYLTRVLCLAWATRSTRSSLGETFRTLLVPCGVAFAAPRFHVG